MRIPDHICDFINHYFDKIFIITVERAVERQMQVSDHLRGLNYDFFFGVDKRHLTIESLEAENIYDETLAREYNRHGKSMVIGHIACALSHRRLYQHILKMGYENVLIFEDDAVPFFGNLDELPATLLELPSSWELLYLGYAKYEQISVKTLQKQKIYRVMSRLKLIKFTPTMVENLLPRPFTEHLSHAGLHDLSHAYCVTKTAAKN